MCFNKWRCILCIIINVFFSFILLAFLAYFCSHSPLNTSCSFFFFFIKCPSEFFLLLLIGFVYDKVWSCILAVICCSIKIVVIKVYGSVRLVLCGLGVIYFYILFMSAFHFFCAFFYHLFSVL